MFPLGSLMLFVGYACVYTAYANLLNGGQGPRLTESLGIPVTVAPPSQEPILTGGQAPR